MSKEKLIKVVSIQASVVYEYMYVSVWLEAPRNLTHTWNILIMEPTRSH